jgi:hypothetical protein
MGLLWFDERTQRALLVAAAVAGGGALAGCGGGSTPGDGGDRLPADGGDGPADRGDVIVDPPPPDARDLPDIGDPPPDAADGEDLIADPPPPDAADREDLIADPPPPDADPPPPDGGDFPPPDPLPPDGGPDETMHDPLPPDGGMRKGLPGAPRPGALPLAPDLKTRIVRAAAGGGSVRLVARTTYRSSSLRFQWEATGGTIEGSGETVLWRPPAGRGRYLVQVVVADGTRAIAVDALTEEVR